MGANSVDSASSARANANEANRYRQSNNELRENYQQQLQELREQSDAKLARAKENYRKDREKLDEGVSDTWVKQNEKTDKRIDQYNDEFKRALSEAKKNYHNEIKIGREKQRKELADSKLAYDVNQDNQVGFHNEVEKQQKDKFEKNFQNIKEKQESEFDQMQKRSVDFRDKLNKDSQESQRRLVRDSNSRLEDERIRFARNEQKERVDKNRQLTDIKRDFEGQKDAIEKFTDYKIENNKANTAERIKRSEEDFDDLSKTLMASVGEERQMLLDKNKEAMIKKDQENLKDIRSLERLLLTERAGKDDIKQMKEKDQITLELKKEKQRKDDILGMQKQFIDKMDQDENEFHEHTNKMKSEMTKNLIQKDVDLSKREKELINKSKQERDRLVHEFHVKENEAGKYHQKQVDNLEGAIGVQRDRFIKDSHDNIEKLVEKSKESISDLKDGYTKKSRDKDLQNTKEKYEISEALRNDLMGRLDKTREALEDKLNHEKREKEQISDKLNDKINRMSKKNGEEAQYKDFIMQETIKQGQVTSKEVMEQKEAVANERYKNLRADLSSKLEEMEKNNKRKFQETVENYETLVARMRLESANRQKTLEIMNKQEKERMKGTYDILLKTTVQQYEDRMSKLREHYESQMDNMKKMQKEKES